MKKTYFLFLLILFASIPSGFSQVLDDRWHNGKPCEEQYFSSDLDVEKIHKICLKEASKYKRKMLKNLLQHKKFGEALRVFLSKKKRFLTEDEFSFRTPLAYEVSSLSDEEIRDLLLQKLRDEVNETYVGEDNLIFPLEISVENEEGQLCHVEMKSAPELKLNEPGSCDFCKPVDIIETFADDCSYFVAKDFSEEEALSLLGVSSDQKNKFCHKDTVPESNLSKIHEFGDKICDLISNGYEIPYFYLTSTRNLYRDKTSRLAQKRGDFIKKYLFHYLTKRRSFCDQNNDLSVGTPDFLKDFKTFEKNFIPYDLYDYSGNRKGDYGPNPYAKPHQYEKEIRQFEDHMDQFIESYFREISDFQKEIQRLASEIKRLELYFFDLNNEYDSLIESDRSVSEITTLATKVASKMIQVNAKINSHRQSVSNLLIKISESQNKLTFYQSDKSRKVDLIRSFYADPLKRKKVWDQKLFNEFKMAKLSFMPLAKDPVDEVLETFDPEVRKYLNALMKVDGFACKFKYNRRPKL